MKWNVILQTDGKTDLGIYNVFDDVGFRLAIEKLFEKKYDKKRFMEELDREAHFSFWAKIEWETVFTTWPPYINREEIDRLLIVRKLTAVKLRKPYYIADKGNEP